MTNRYRIEIARRWADVDRRWCEATDSLRASPFQHPDWLRTWYAAFGSSAGITPLLVAVTDAASGDLAVLMPLIERRSGPLVFLEFADLDVTDCNAPALGPAAPTIAEAAVQLWREVSAALPACDVVRFAKMPAVIGNRPNPLAALPGAQPSELRTWSLHAGGSWEDYLKSLDRPYRKELGRSLRLFEGAGAGRFLVAKSDVDASRILTVIDELQRDRLEERQAKHIFDQPAHHRFYNEFAAAGMNSGSCALTALELDGEIVAGLLAIVDKPRLTLLRIANRGGSLARLGLGRLLIERTLCAMHAEGFTHFDFSIGDGPHKKRFAAEPSPLLGLQAYVSWRGRAYARAQQAKSLIRQMPGAQRLIRGLNRGSAPAA